MIRLNLGCGNDIRKGWQNYDKYPTDSRVKYLDLADLPLPFPTGYADEIILLNAYEHLWVNHFEFICELSRILKPRGRLTISICGYKNILGHEQHVFNNHYFDTTVKDYKLFKKVKCVITLNTFSAMFTRLKKLLLSVIVQRYTFEFRK